MIRDHLSIYSVVMFSSVDQSIYRHIVIHSRRLSVSLVETDQVDVFVGISWNRMKNEAIFFCQQIDSPLTYAQKEWVIDDGESSRRE